MKALRYVIADLLSLVGRSIFRLPSALEGAAGQIRNLYWWLAEISLKLRLKD